jgi:hypothetical protein
MAGRADASDIADRGDVPPLVMARRWSATTAEPRALLNRLRGVASPPQGEGGRA